MSHPLSRYKPIADALSLLFQPNVEVVIHNIQEDRVYYIANPVSGRKPGDTSFLKLDSQDLANNDAVIGPYENVGKNGQRIRSVTAILTDEQNRGIGLMCINLDYSIYEPALNLLKGLIRPPQTEQHPEILFQNDWRGQIKFEILSFLETHHLSIETLKPENRKEMMAWLDNKGIFYAKKSIEQIAVILGVSRATAYNDLMSVRKTAKKKIRRLK